MGVIIDPRLLEAESEPNITENFNRVLGIIQDLENRVNPLIDVEIEAEKGTTKIFAQDTSDFQDNVEVDGNKITGELNYVTTGQVATDWGAGNFLVLKFTNLDDAVTAGATSVKVGLDPSVSSGLVEVLGDPDGNGVFKITDKDAQKFVIVSTNGKFSKRQEFDLSGLTVAKS